MSFSLEGVKIPTEFKAFYCDTGLLISQLSDDIPAKILSGDLSAYKGAIAENMVASAFTSNDMKLYYFHAPSGSPELDFLFEDNGEAVIVECKATNNQATSMKYVIGNQKNYGIHPAIKLADTNIVQGDGFTTYPLYAIGFMEPIVSNTVIEPVDIKQLKIPDNN
nr:DUF4143 domain-containing protein [Butyrivibrio sp. WCD2001]